MKSLLYKEFKLAMHPLIYVFVFFLMGGMVYLCVNPIYKLLEQSGFVENITTVYADFLTNLNFTQLLLTINDLILQFVSGTSTIGS